MVNSVNLSNANQGTNLQLNNKYYTTAGLTSLNPLTSPEHKKGNKIYILYIDLNINYFIIAAIF